MKYVERKIKKVMQEYGKASIPLQVIKHVDAIHKAREAAGNKCRKADIWIEMAKKVTK